jgi:hypothetical protein
MIKKREKIDVLATMIVYHENVEQLKRNLQDITTSLLSNNPVQGAEKLKMLYQRDFIDHFRFEETIVFPAVQAWQKGSEYDKLIEEYIVIHGHLLPQANDIVTLLASVNGPLSKEVARAAITAIAKLTGRMCGHARHEDEHLVPLIKANPTLRFLSSRKLIACKATFKSIFADAESPNQTTT